MSRARCRRRTRRSRAGASRRARRPSRLARAGPCSPARRSAAGAAPVVLVFLWNWRSMLIAAIAIPTSIIATFGLVWYEDFTLNSMTMLALTLAVGIVIDDAIVVLENIYRFVDEKGMNPYEAAVECTKGSGLAVIATTFSP